jgi:hypothetical protein
MKFNPDPEKLLVGDHVDLNGVLTKLKEALSSGDIETSHAELDFFWARLAVHIRAEHLQLFPSVIDRLGKVTLDRAGAPSLGEGQLVVERLRADHDFFMHELARSINILRRLSNASDREKINVGLKTVQDTLLEVEKRLTIHNEFEETLIYRWTTLILNEQEQADLAKRINAELANYPSRFSRETWSNH